MKNKVLLGLALLPTLLLASCGNKIITLEEDQELKIVTSYSNYTYYLNNYYSGTSRTAKVSWVRDCEFDKYDESGSTDFATTSFRLKECKYSITNNLIKLESIWLYERIETSELYSGGNYYPYTLTYYGTFTEVSEYNYVSYSLVTLSV